MLCCKCKFCVWIAASWADGHQVQKAVSHSQRAGNHFVDADVEATWQGGQDDSTRISPLQEVSLLSTHLHQKSPSLILVATLEWRQKLLHPLTHPLSLGMLDHFEHTPDRIALFYFSILSKEKNHCACQFQVSQFYANLLLEIFF